MSDGVVGWLRKGAWSVIDHGMSSVASFVVNLLLIWWISPEAYGAFVVALSAMMLLTILQAAALTEPMLIMLPKRQAAGARDYLGGVLAVQLLVAASVAVLFGLGAVGAYRLGRLRIAETLLGLAIAAPLILTQELLRRVHYARLSPRFAAVATSASTLLSLAGVALLHRAGQLRLWSALAALAAAALLASLGMAATLPRPWSATRLSLRQVAREHREHARWLVGSAVFRWAPLNLFYVVLPPLFPGGPGLVATGVLRATMNLIRPLLTALSALVSLAVPAFSAQVERGETPPRGKLRALVLGVSLAYWGLLAGLGDPVVRWIYGAELAYPPRLIALLGLMPLLHGAMVLTHAELMARRRTDAVFKSSLLATVGALAAGIPLTYLHRLYGAAGGILIAYAILFGVQAALLRRATSANSSPPPSPR